jgi:thymidylate synthase (FAD)
LRFLIKSRHWSPFELADFTVEVITSRAIAAQILRHKSMSIQEFSLRYAASPCEFEPQEARVKGDTNRQGSLPATPTVERLWQAQLKEVQQQTVEMYQAALRNNIAPEVARMMLPLGVQTRLYLKNSVRGWIHYLEARTDPHAQHEHRLVALAIKEIFKEQFPDTHAAVFEHE